jgi:hypothetical protein
MHEIKLPATHPMAERRAMKALHRRGWRKPRSSVIAILLLAKPYSIKDCGP